MVDIKELTNNEISAIADLYRRYIDMHRPSNNWYGLDGDARKKEMMSYVVAMANASTQATDFVRRNLGKRLAYQNELATIKQMSDISESERTKKYKDAKSKYEQSLVW